MKSRNIGKSFNNAVDGIIYAITSQRNMKIHLIFAILVVILAMILNISRIEMILLLITIGIVIGFEMLNTAIEEVVNLVTQEHHPLAKIAKNVAAGAVLTECILAVCVGYFIFFERLANFERGMLRQGFNPDHIAVLALLVVVSIIIVFKRATGSSDYLRGGMPSGHTAIAFSLATTIMFISDLFVSILAFSLAFLVGHTRVQSKIHTVGEVISGGLLGILITAILFQLR